MGPPLTDDQQSVYLKEALSVVQIQSRLMRQCLDKNKLMDGIKHCSNMLAELRTSLLTPKNYYQLYMFIFDSMRYMTSYLVETHEQGKHHLGDLYELVQYASNIIPRLYLMTTVGSIYLSVSDAPPVGDVMSDMMEMIKGVQHPIRGLFLRHYLGGMTRDFLPNNGQHLDACIQFILTNFAEMNKLWVRLQYLGHTKDKAKRELERKEMGTLVGTNLVRLSQLEGVDLKVYQRDILPGILNQVVNCHDVMAQEYLMEVIIQIFPDEFHMQTLKPFLATTAQLHPKVNIKAIIMALLDSLTAFIKDETEQLSISEQDNSKNLVVKQETDDDALFLMFWNEIMELIKTRQDFPIGDQTSLFLSLAHFSISCYPNRLDYIDQILLFTKESIFDKMTPELHTKQSESNILELLLLPAKTWDVLKLIIDLKYFQPLLAVQSYQTRRIVALAILDNILDRETRIEQPEQVYQLLEICHVLVKDKNYIKQPLYPYVDDDDRDEHGWVARLIHLFYSDEEDVQFLLLSAARQQLEKGDKDRVKVVFPSLIISSLKLAKRYMNKKPVMLKSMNEEGQDVDDNNENKEDRASEEPTKEEEREEEQKEEETNIEWTKKMTTLYHFIHQIIMVLYRECEQTESICVQFTLMAGQNANQCGFEQVAYQFYLDAFRIYEDSVSHSRAQFNAIVYSIGSLLEMSPKLQEEHYVHLSTKITLYSAKLLKKPDQSRAVYLSSRLWTTDKPSRVLECLQKSLKIADSCMDTVTNEMLFLELLNQYVYYYEQGNELITPTYIEGLTELIQSRLEYLNQTDQHPMTSSSSSLLEHDKQQLADYIIRQFNETIEHIKRINHTL